MGRSWGVYVRFGKICFTKRFESLHQAKERYERLVRRKKILNKWIALVPIYD